MIKIKRFPLILLTLVIVLFLSASNVSATNQTSFTVDQVCYAAGDVKSCIEDNHTLPNSVNIAENQISMPQFLEISTRAVLNINNNSNDNITPGEYDNADSPKENFTGGDISFSQYLDIADYVSSYMDVNGRAPDYAAQINTGNAIGYESLIYMYAKILDFYNINKVLPLNITINPWLKEVSVNLASDDSIIGSTSYGYVEKGYYGNLSSSQTIAIIIGIHPLESGIHDAIAGILSALSSNLNKKFVIYKVHVTQNAGNYDIGRMNGQLLAQRFVVPDISGENPIIVADIHENKYTYSGYAYPRFLDVISSSQITWIYVHDIITVMPFLVTYSPPNPTSPQYVTIPIANKGIPTIIYETYFYDSWESKVSDANAFIVALDKLLKLTVNNDQVIDAAVWVKNYVETRKILPDYVTIKNTNINMASFLQLLTQTILNINSGQSDVNCIDHRIGPNSRDELTSGNISQNEYMEMAYVIKTSMDFNLFAPEFYENISLGRFFGFENMIYTFSSILADYNSTKTLPGSIGVKPWKQLTTIIFSPDQVITAANWVQNYIDTGKKLPDYVIVDNTYVIMPTFLHLLTKTILNINNGTNSTINSTYHLKGAVSRDELSSGNMSQGEYLKIAGVIKSSMDINLVAPEFYENISLGRFFGFENMIYTFSSILTSYNTTKILPGSIKVMQWKLLAKYNFTLSDILISAEGVKNYVDMYKKLPEYISINTLKVDMPSFLELITTAVLNVKNNDLNSLIYLYNCVKGALPRDELSGGNMSQGEYLKIAGVVKSSMDINLVAPEFYENISMGRFFGFENMIYTFSSIVVSYNTTGILPSSLTVNPWKQVIAISFTFDQVLAAAKTVKEYVDNYKELPDYIKINNIDVIMPSVLELFTTATLNIQKNDQNSLLPLFNCLKGSVPRDDLKSGNMPRSEYLKIAYTVKTTMDSNQVAPEFYENISLGRFFGFENMIYTFSSILTSYNTTKILPGSIPVMPWKIVTATSFSLNDVLNASSWVKDYADNYKKLPDNVLIGTTNVTMPSFLELITTATLNIQNNDINSLLYLYSCVKGPIPRDQIQGGNMSQDEYLKIASVIKFTMDSNGVAPEFYENISLGRFFGYENMVYTFSSILACYNITESLPIIIAVNPWIF